MQLKILYYKIIIMMKFLMMVMLKVFHNQLEKYQLNFINILYSNNNEQQMEVILLMLLLLLIMKLMLKQHLNIIYTRHI